MSEPDDLSFSELREKRSRSLPVRRSEEPAQRTEGSSAHSATVSPASPAQANPTQTRRALPFDPQRIISAIKARRRRLGWVAAITALVGLIAGYLTAVYSLKITFILQHPATAATAKAAENTDSRLLTTETLVTLMQSSELLRRVSETVQPPISSPVLAARLQVRRENESDLVSATLASPRPKSLVGLASVYAREATAIGRELETAEARRVSQFYQERLAATERDIATATAEMVQFQRDARVLDPESEAQVYMKQYSELLARADSARIEQGTLATQIAALQAELEKQSPVAQQLSAAKAKLSELLGRYTDEHPTVQSQRKEIEALEKQLKAAEKSSPGSNTYAENSMAGALYLRLVEMQTRQTTVEKELQGLDKFKADLQSKVTGLSEKGVQYAMIKTRLDALKNTRSLLSERQREAQLSAEKAQGYLRLFAPPNFKDINLAAPTYHALKTSLAGLLAGTLVMISVIAVREIRDDRVKTAADVERVTGLPVLAQLGDLNSMSPAERDQWAFRTWTALSSQLNASPNHGLVCGIMSSTAGEGRSTWINLLAGAASQRGLRVLAVAAQPPTKPKKPNAPEEFTQSPPSPPPSQVRPQMELQMPVALSSPDEVARQLARRDAEPVAYLPLNDWVWNLERRQQWQKALARWRTVDDLVMLIELPPASSPEAVLLAENIPQVIWLASSGKSRAKEARGQLETIRHAKCRLACAVLNHQPESAYKI